MKALQFEGGEFIESAIFTGHGHLNVKTGSKVYFSAPEHVKNLIETHLKKKVNLIDNNQKVAKSTNNKLLKRQIETSRRLTNQLKELGEKAPLNYTKIDNVRKELENLNHKIAKYDILN